MGNRKCRCELGHIHDSRLEAGHCRKLQTMKNGGAIKDFQIQKSFKFYENGVYLGSHKVDFYVTPKEGEPYVLESKGFENVTWKKKHKLFLKCFPDVDYIIWRRP